MALPILVVCGSKDILVNAFNSKFVLARSLQAKVISYEEGGHGVFEQFEEKINSALHAHFEEGEKHTSEATFEKHHTLPEPLHPWKAAAYYVLFILLLRNRLKSKPSWRTALMGMFLGLRVCYGPLYL